MAACPDRRCRSSISLPRPRLRPVRSRPGMRLVREWNGMLHVVTIEEDGSICVERAALDLAERGRPRDHRHALVGPGLLRLEARKKAA